MSDIAQAQEIARLLAKIGKCSSPSFSPDNDQFAFASDLNGTPQVWRMSLSGGFPELVTALDTYYVSKVQWSPNGDWLAFESAPGGGMNTQIFIVRPNGMDLQQLTSGGSTNNWLGAWSKNSESIFFSSNQNHSDRMETYQVDIKTGEIKQIGSNVGTSRVESISSDGSQILVNRVIYRGDNNIYLIDLKNNTETLLTPHDPPANFANARFSPDDNAVYLISNWDSDFSQLVKISLENEEDWITLHSRSDAEIDAFTLSKDATRAVIIWNLAGRTELELFDLENNKTISMIDLPGEVASSASFLKNEQTLVLQLSDSQRPDDIWLYDITTQELQQLTRSPHAGISLNALVRPTLEIYEAHDDLELSGWLYLPTDVECPCPLVLSFHGGPEGQERPRFRADYQALLALGMGVFAPNIRGSSGFGKRFLNLDNGALRRNAVQDIKSTVTHLVDQKIAQSGKIGIMGGSYGGYMTMAGLTEFPDLFAAGVNIYGVVNFQTFFEKTEPWMASISKVIYGDPDTQIELLYDLSPMTNIQRVTAPTLVIHGDNDTNVPVYEAEQVVQKLREQNIPVEYILFPDEGHGFKNEKNRITSTVAISNWFQQYLIGD